MCDGNECQLKENCFRYKATPSKFRQSYFIETPNENLECEYYLKLE